jgi:Tol biopolymer transport system component
MSLAPGTRLGPYEIVSSLGAGGMGEVYRARDARLDRTVAIKLLPDTVAPDPDARERFDREARAASSLNHPNILSVFDVGREANGAYLVTELIEGVTLRERLRDGAVPPREIVNVGAQIADGLAAAHGAGLVHRDLKPENIMVTREGRAKILDFGLAKPVHDSAITQQTRTDISHAGMLVGTVGYISPEQVRGQTADARSDLFSLGVVLYELAAGRQPFARATAIETLNAVLKEDALELSSAVPDGLRQIVSHCLEKEPERRFQTAADVAFALRSFASGTAVTPTTMPAMTERRRQSTRRALAAAAALALVSAGVLAGRWTAEGDVASPVLRYEAYTGFDAAPAVSPDGKTLAFTSTRDGTSRVWLKQLTGGGEAALTSGPDSYPRFHPDGTSLLFIRREGDRNALFRQAIVGGEPRRLAVDIEEADWSPDGRQIVMVRRQRGATNATASTLLIAAADGADPRSVAVVESVVTHPRWSPDGTTLAASEFGLRTQRRLALISVADGTVRMLDTPLARRRMSSPSWLADGRLAYAQAESVTADTSGSAARIYAHDIRRNTTRMLLWTPVNAEVLDVAGDGSLIWDGVSAVANLRVFDISGGPSGPTRSLTRGQSNDRQPIFSRDGEWIVFTSNRSGNLDLWATSLSSGATKRLTDDEGDDWDPGVTHDGRLVWSSARSGNFEIWSANFDGSDARQISRDGVDAENPTTTRDGWVVYTAAEPRSGIWKMRLDGSAVTQIAAGDGIAPEVSPDGALVVATVQTRGTPQVRIQVFRVADGAKVPFEIVLPSPELTFGIGRARWMPDGKRLAFLGLDERGVRGIYVQDFVAGSDTTATRRRLAAFDAEMRTESFAISPDGRTVVATATDQLRTILRADGLPGVARPRR